jgi:hypothetical protein
MKLELLFLVDLNEFCFKKPIIVTAAYVVSFYLSSSRVGPKATWRTDDDVVYLRCWDRDIKYSKEGRGRPQRVFPGECWSLIHDCQQCHWHAQFERKTACRLMNSNVHSTWREEGSWWFYRFRLSSMNPGFL